MNFFITTEVVKTDRNIQNPGIKLTNNEDYIINNNNKFAPAFKHIRRLNNYYYNWLKDNLQNINKNKHIIVVTHYLPSKKCIHQKYKDNEFNDMYFTDCEDLMKYADIWISGHTHDPFTGNINGCSIFVNPIGIPNETTNYNKSLVIETYQSHL